MNKQTGTSSKPLEGWRSEIDRIDTELLRLLNQRARIACELGVIKTRCGLPAYDGRRERRVLARMRAENPGPLGPDSVTRIFRRIILETRRIGIWSMRKQRGKASIKDLSQEQCNGH